MRQKSRLNRRQSKKFVERRQFRLYAMIFFVILTIAGSIYGFFSLTHSRTITIDNVEVKGNAAVPSEMIRLAVLEALSSAHVGIFSKANIFLYPKNQLEKALSNLSPEIMFASVKSIGLRTLEVEISERSPVARVCAGLPNFDNERSVGDIETRCYLIDDSAFVYAVASSSDPVGLSTYYIPALAESTSTDSLLGLTAIDPSRLSALQDFYAGAIGNGLIVQAILVLENGEYEMYVGETREETNEGTVIYFNENQSFVRQLSNLISFLNGMKVKGLGQPSDYEYLNLRFGTNVFYKRAETTI